MYSSLMLESQSGDPVLVSEVTNLILKRQYINISYPCLYLGQGCTGCLLDTSTYAELQNADALYRHLVGIAGVCICPCDTCGCYSKRQASPR
eukprot:jgi/Chrzof1/13231/Cz07g25160.t1